MYSKNMSTLGLVENLHWMNHGFENFDMLAVYTIGDGNCFFHSLCQAYFIPYRTQMVNHMPLSRREIVRNLRYGLSKRLGEPVDPLDPDGPSFYETLSRGELPNFGKEIPAYSFQEMQSRLRNSEAVGNEYNEFVSDQLKKDIYILDGDAKDVYITGNDDELLYKNRDSIVVLYRPGHYETVGIQSGSSSIQTYFSPSHPFIQFLSARMKEKREEGSAGPP
jgi:hypothetical protein